MVINELWIFLQKGPTELDKGTKVGNQYCMMIEGLDLEVGSVKGSRSLSLQVQGRPTEVDQEGVRKSELTPSSEMLPEVSRGKTHEYGSPLGEGNSYRTWISDRRLSVSYRLRYPTVEVILQCVSASSDRTNGKEREDGRVRLSSVDSATLDGTSLRDTFFDYLRRPVVTT